MPDHEQVPRSVNPVNASKSADPGFGELLASCAAASAVSTPPVGNAPDGSADEAARTPPPQSADAA